MKNNEGYPSYSSKRPRTIQDIIDGQGIQKEGKFLVLKEVDINRVKYYAKLIKSNFSLVTEYTSI